MISINNKKINLDKEISIEELLDKIYYVKDCAVVRLNGRLISKPNFKSTIIKDKSEIILIPMIAGG